MAAGIKHGVIICRVNIVEAACVLQLLSRGGVVKESLHGCRAVFRQRALGVYRRAASVRRGDGNRYALSVNR